MNGVYDKGSPFHTRRFRIIRLPRLQRTSVRSMVVAHYSLILGMSLQPQHCIRAGSHAFHSPGTGLIIDLLYQHGGNTLTANRFRNHCMADIPRTVVHIISHMGLITIDFHKEFLFLFIMFHFHRHTFELTTPRYKIKDKNLCEKKIFH